jgi:hypothetical protein
MVVTDTLTCWTQGGPVSHFSSKVHPLQHIKMMMSGTGVAAFIAEWYKMVAYAMLVTDIDHLDHHTPESLRDLWAKGGYGEVEGVTSTVYHFGWSEADARFVSYAYRSTEGFASERQEDGIALKPFPEEIDDIAAWIDGLSWEKVALQQQAEDRKRAGPPRVGIGGDLLCYNMTATPEGEVSITSWKVMTFPHAETDCLEAFMRHAAHEAERG